MSGMGGGKPGNGNYRSDPANRFNDFYNKKAKKGSKKKAKKTNKHLDRLFDGIYKVSGVALLISWILTPILLTDYLGDKSWLYLYVVHALMLAYFIGFVDEEE